MKSADETPKDAARRLAASAIRDGYEPQALHTYTDANGYSLYYRMRLKHPTTHEKWIRPMKRTDNRFVLGEPDFPNGKPLYHLREISISQDEVFVVEGEWCADQMAKLGVLATTSGGADSAERADWTPLAGRAVTIWPDNDDAGRRYASAVESGLRGLAATVRVIDVAMLNLPPKGDFVEWHLANPNADKTTLAAIANVAVSQSSASKPTVVHLVPENLNMTSTLDAEGEESWQPPSGFDSHALPVFPVAALPSWLAAFVRAVTASTQTPVDLAGVLSLSLLSTAVGNKARVQIRSDYVEPLAIYTAIALDPASRKSAVFRLLTEPLDEIEKRERKELEPEIARLTARRESLQKDLAQCDRQLAKGGDKVVDSRNRRAAVQAELAALAIPVPRKCYVDDVTVERLAGIIQENGGAASVLSAEGGGPFAMMAGRYSAGEANFDVYLKGHAGDTLKVHRIGRPETIVYRPVLSVGLTLQPDVLKSLAQSHSMRGRGLLGRFLYSMPRNTVGMRQFDAPSVGAEQLADYGVRIQRLVALKQEAGTDGEPRPISIRLSPAAEHVLRQFFDWAEPRLRSGEELSSMRDWAGKLVGHAVRIAALFHLAEHATSGVAWGNLTISGETAEQAVFVARYFVPHALAAFEEMEATPELDASKRLLEWIIRNGEPQFSRADAYRALRRTKAFDAPSKLDKPLELLEGRGFVRPKRSRQVEARPGRPGSPLYEVNPSTLPLKALNPPNRPLDSNRVGLVDLVAASAPERDAYADEERAAIQEFGS